MKDRSEQDTGAPVSRPEGIGRDTKPLRGTRTASLQPPRSRSSLTWILLVSIALLFVAALGARYWMDVISNEQDLQAPITPPTSLESLVTEYPQLATILSDSKIDSVYKEFLVAYETGGGDAALELAEKRGMLNSEGDLRLTLELDTTDTAPLEVELEANFIEVTAVNGNLMDIAVPVRRLELVMASGSVDDLLASLTNLEHVQRIRLPVVSIVDTPDRQPERAPQLTFLPTPATSTPQPFPLLPIDNLQTPQNATLVILAILLCLVAPALFFLGGFLLLMGFGMIRRDDRRRAGAQTKVSSSLSETAVAEQAQAAESSGRPVASTGAQAQPASGRSTQPQKPAGAVSVSQNPAPPSRPAQTGEVVPTVVGATRDEPVSAQLQVVCLTCGRVNRSGARFCAACGSDLKAPKVGLEAEAAQPAVLSKAVVDEPPGESSEPSSPTFCWNCGRRLRPTSRFCPYCGDRV